MTTELTTIENGSFEQNAALMGFDQPQGESNESNLKRLRIWHSALMGEAEVKGKKKKIEVVEAGTYRIENGEDAEGNFQYAYAKEIIVRPFLQRFMYKRYVPNKGAGPNEKKGDFIKTQMHDNLDVDLKDTSGGFNCGKPAGYIKDFKALPEKTQDLIKQIKRVRVLFGTVTLVDPTDEKGEQIEALDDVPFLWEIDNRDAFKLVGQPFNALSKKRQLPINHRIKFSLTEEALNNGDSFFLPEAELQMQSDSVISDEDKTTFEDFVEWLGYYNEYVKNAFAEKHKEEVNPEDAKLVDEFIEVEAIDVEVEEVEDED